MGIKIGVSFGPNTAFVLGHHHSLIVSSFMSHHIPEGLFGGIAAGWDYEFYRHKDWNRITGLGLTGGYIGFDNYPSMPTAMVTYTGSISENTPGVFHSISAAGGAGVGPIVPVANCTLRLGRGVPLKTELSVVLWVPILFFILSALA